MDKTRKWQKITSGLTLIFMPFLSSAVEISGEAGIESRYFIQDNLYEKQTNQQFSLHGEIEFYSTIGNENNSLTFTPYFRVDSEDSARHQLDIRELMYLHIGNNWEFKAGIGKVFWGVTETLHLVDIINQTDVLASFDGEEKLGQAMIQYTQITDFGIFDAFVLPGFRKRSFADQEGRLRPELAISDKAIYESSDEEKHIDYAIRWSNTVGNWDIGLSWFKGTAREAQFSVTQSPETEQASAAQLTPFYGIIDQIGLDLQYIHNAWLWKLEAIKRTSKTQTDTTAYVGGFEYSQIGILDSIIDLGWVVEYAHDQRSAFEAPRQNDLSLATRWVFNDAESTEFLIGISQDLDYSDSKSFFVEGSTRLGQSWVLTIDAWLFSADSPEELSYNIRNDDFVQLDLSYYF